MGSVRDIGLTKGPAHTMITRWASLILQDSLVSDLIIRYLDTFGF